MSWLKWIVAARALKEIHLHYVAKWMRCAPHFAAATWIAL